MKKKVADFMKNSGPPTSHRPGEIYVPGLGMRTFTRMLMKSYYYGIPFPQDFEQGATIGLFDDHIGDPLWTNLTRPRMLPVGHKATIFKVTLAVKPTDQTNLAL